MGRNYGKMIESTGAELAAEQAKSVDSEERTSQVRAILGIGGLAVLALAVRLPFLDAGYGDINDAWRVAQAAHDISVTGSYVASRMPPHPVQEFVSSFLWQGGPAALNGATAVLSVVAVILMTLVLRRLGARDYLIGGLAFGLTPVIFINSTNSTDYLWALAGLLGCLYFILQDRPVLAGICLGLAIGSRITSGAFVVPVGILIFQRAPAESRIRRIVMFALTSCVVGGLIFIPALMKYGWDILSFSDELHPSLLEIGKLATVDIWGSIGVAALVLAVGVIVLHLIRRMRIPVPAIPENHLGIWLLTIVLYGIAFIRLPHLAGYLVPIVPFVLLALGTTLGRPAFVALCAALILSSFIGIGRSGLEAGPILADHASRIESVRLNQEALQEGARLPDNSIIVAGHWLPVLSVYLLREPSPRVQYVWLLTAQDLSTDLAQGRHIYYLPGQREYNLDQYQIDLLQAGATPLTVQ